MNTRFDAHGHELVAADEVALLLLQLRRLDEATVEELICHWGLEWRCTGGERCFVLADAVEFVNVVLEVHPRSER
jgi:hypothetical protein